ncbi:MAG: hypothetical protein KC464_35720, partial [Myxococcales bacterium]|nr:hypothetical protein [Myxococcales bacterium]
TARIHRFEAGEHADAVDGAVARARASGMDVDDGMAGRMQQGIRLTNGRTVSPGEITAMMGDFYGAYTTGPDGREHFDPAAAFEAMDNADPEEMDQILAHVRQEQAGVTDAIEHHGGEGFEPSAPADLESITQGRHLHTEGGTTTGYSFLELAERNTNHFSTESEEGTDNNMGAYGAFHQMAMQQAQRAQELPPGPEHDEAVRRARAMEASSQHFMTDRFAGGHQFDKQQLMDNNSTDDHMLPGANWADAKEANIRASVVHNEMNRDGVDVHNPNVDGGIPWHAAGDGEWATAGNEDNRTHTARGVVASYAEVDSILQGDSTAADHADPTATAHQYVPDFDPEVNDRAQQRALDVDAGDIVEAEASQLPVIPQVVQRIGRNIVHSVEDSSVGQAVGGAWDWLGEQAGNAVDAVESGASRAWDATTDTAGRVWDATTDTAGRAWDATTDAASRAWDATTDTAGRAWDATTDTAGRAWDATTDTASRAWDATSEGASRAWDWTTEHASDAAATVQNGASRAWDATTSAASSAASTVQDGASRAWDATTSAASSAASTVQEGASQAWGATRRGASAAADAASAGASWVGDQASSVFHGLFD